MDNVVDLSRWRRARKAPATARAEGSIGRLDGAVRRLDPLASEMLDRAGRLDPAVETELLAVMGAIGIGLMDLAAERAERLAARLAHPVGTGDGSLA
jgi:hypothetical protein